MATRSVNVLIKARDEASKKFGVIGVSSKVMGAALKTTARSIRWSFTRAFAGISASAKLAFRGITAMARRALRTIKTTVRRIAQGIAAAFAYSTYAAMKQQAAEIELASALKMAGTYSDALMEKLKQQASAIQENSTYGDEYILSLMRMAKTLGWTEDKLADAAKAAIALHAGFGGRGKPEIFLRFYTDAINGTAKSLDTYIGELRTAKTEEERQIILQKNIAKGWDVVKSKTESAGGALKQMWNTIGDVYFEAFGSRFLDDITRSAKAIKKWSEDNREAIAHWADVTHSYVTLVKDLFKAYIDFMKDDWKEGFRKSLDSTIVLFKAWGQSLKLVFEKIFADIGANIGPWLANARNLKIIQKETARTLLKEQGARLPFGRKPMYGRGEIFSTKAQADKAWDDAMEKAGNLVKEAYDAGSYPELKKPKGIGSWAPVGQQIKAINKEALDKIKDIMPDFAKDVEKAFAESEKRLLALKNKKYVPATPPGKEPPGEPEEGPKTAFGRLIQKLPAREARLLTAAPGAKYDYAQQTARNTKQSLSRHDKLVKLQGKTVALLEKLTRPGSGTQLQAANFS